MLHIVLFEPQIPQNTGNVGRLCAVTRSRLHLIHPLGFRITDRELKRAGMDYWYALDVHHHENWEAFQRSPARPRTALAVHDQSGAIILGRALRARGTACCSATRGPAARSGCTRRWATRGGSAFPHANAAMRSLNLSTAVGIACYEALRQIRSAPRRRREAAGREPGMDSGRRMRLARSTAGERDKT